MFPFGSYVLCIVLHLPTADFFCSSMDALCAGTAAQDRIEGSLVPQEAGLEFELEKQLKYCLKAFQIRVPSCCGSLCFLAQGVLFHK